MAIYLLCKILKYTIFACNPITTLCEFNDFLHNSTLTIPISHDTSLNVLELSCVHVQSCYMKVANNRAMVNVCVVDNWDW